MTGAQYDPLVPAEFRTGADGKNNPYYVDFSDEIDAIFDLADELAGEPVSRKVGTMQGAFAAMANAAGADPQVDENAPVEESIRAMSGKLGGTQMAKVWVGFNVDQTLTGDPTRYFTATRGNAIEDTTTPINFVEDSTYEDNDFVGYYECPVGETIAITPVDGSESGQAVSFSNESDGLAVLGNESMVIVVFAGPDLMPSQNLPSRSATIRIQPKTS